MHSLPVTQRALLAATAVAFTFGATAVVAQTTDKRYALRPVKCVAYDPQPSDFEAQRKASIPPPGGPGLPDAYFDSDFFNGNFIALWGDDGMPGARKDLDTFQGAGLNMLHLYNWNSQRTDHTSALDAALQRGIKVMVPINNYMKQTIAGEVCGSCKKGYSGALALLEESFVQIYDVHGSKKPHAAAAMWAIFNEYDLNGYDPQFVSFVTQAILTLEKKYSIAAEDLLPITSPVSDAIFRKADRDKVPRPLGPALDVAAAQWFSYPGNAGKSDADLPGGVLATMAIANALVTGQKKVDYKAPFESTATTVAAIPADLWKARWIASTNPFRDGGALKELITSDGGFVSGFPGTTDFNTLPPLFFGEMGRGQVSTDSPVGSDEAKAKQAAFVLDQVVTTQSLAAPDKTKGGYFLGSCFFQHTYVDASHFEGFEMTGAFETRDPAGPVPGNASGAKIRVDTLVPLPVWTSVKQGYASALTTEELEDWVAGNPPQ